MIFSGDPVIDESVVVEEEPAGDVERHEDVDAVMLMGSQDKEDAEAVEEPGEGVEEVDPPAGVLGDEEVEEGEGDGVTGEHVVTASPSERTSVGAGGDDPRRQDDDEGEGSPDPLDREPRTRPDDVCIPQSVS